MHLFDRIRFFHETQQLPYLSDYKTHVSPPKFGRKMGVHLIVRMWLTWLTVGGRAVVEKGFFPVFLLLNPRVSYGPVGLIV